MRLFYRKYGTGAPLIILHGLFGSSDNWITVARSLSGRFTIYLPDQRNHGQSPHSAVHDYGSMKDDIARFADELGLEKFFLAGHSMGGRTAMKYALNFPERINGLLVADISPFRNMESYHEDREKHLGILNFMLSADISGISSRSAVESLMKPAVSQQKTRDLLMKNLKRQHDNSFSWKLNPEALLQNLEKIMDGIVDDLPEKTSVTGFPVFFLRGERSWFIRESDFSNIMKLFPGAEFITIPGAGHWLHHDNPRAVTECFFSLLDG